MTFLPPGTANSKGIWLTDDPDYQKWVEALSSSDPRLKRRSPRNTLRRVPWPAPLLRLAVFETDACSPSTGGQSKWRHTKFQEAESFRESLSIPSDPDGRRIIVLEGQNPTYIGILGNHFSIHPSFFVSQERETTPEALNCDAEMETTALPSTITEHISMKYYVLLYLPPETRKFGLFCAETGRYISITRILGEFCETGLLHRRCTVWRRYRTAGQGWDCIILTDPPLRSVRAKWEDPAKTTPISPIPHQGGYLDFVPHRNQIRAGSGPPQTSMHDDISFYLTRHADLFSPDNSDSEMPLQLAQKIVASHYQKHIGFLHGMMSYLQHSMSRQERLDIFKPILVEKQWSDVQQWERRVSQYGLDLDAIMAQSGIPLLPPDNTHHCNDGDAIARDFHFLRTSLREVRRRIELASSSITGLAGIAGNRQAIHEQTLSRQEATSMKALTVVGLVFLPLSFATSLFSMTGPYSFGEDKFWVYFAFSVPLCLLAFGIYFFFGGSWARQPGRLLRPRRKVKLLDEGDSLC